MSIFSNWKRKPNPKNSLANPEKIRALAIDLDGTLLSPGAVLTERTSNAIKGCMARGIKIIIATGRPVEGVEQFRSALGAEGPMIYFNGAVVADMPEGKILKTTYLDVKAAEFCVDLAREMGVYCQIYIPDGNDKNRIPLMAERDGPERKYYNERINILSELVDLKEVLNRPGIKGCAKVMLLAEPEVLAEIRPHLDERLGGGTAMPGIAYIAQTHRTFLEIMDTKASKGRGLQFVMDHLSLKSEEVIAFGDEENDLPMFTVAGFSVAPSNAKDSVKTQADIIVGSNTDDGVAVFLEGFFRV